MIEVDRLRGTTGTSPRVFFLVRIVESGREVERAQRLLLGRGLLILGGLEVLLSDDPVLLVGQLLDEVPGVGLAAMDIEDLFGDGEHTATLVGQVFVAGTLGKPGRDVIEHAS